MKGKTFFEKPGWVQGSTRVARGAEPLSGLLCSMDTLVLWCLGRIQPGDRRRQGLGSGSSSRLATSEKMENHHKCADLRGRGNKTEINLGGRGGFVAACVWF